MWEFYECFILCSILKLLLIWYFFLLCIDKHKIYIWNTVLHGVVASFIFLDTFCNLHTGDGCFISSAASAGSQSPSPTQRDLLLPTITVDSLTP
jgi:hypothetical protein